MPKIKIRFMYDEQGEKKGVIIPLKDFEKSIEKIEDWLDYEYAQKQGKKKTKLIPFKDVLKKLEKQRP